MEQNILNMWEKYHIKKSERLKLNNCLRELWDESDNYNINYDEALPIKISKADFNKIKLNSEKLYIYSNSVLKSFLKQNYTENLGVIVFSKEGCIIKLYGNKEFLEWSSRNSIREGTIWDEKDIGVNIFSYGYRTKSNVSMEGEENYSRFLIKGAYYFSPIVLRKDNFYGGLALVAPFEEKSPYLRYLVDSLTRSIELQMFWFNISETYTNTIEGSGIISIDQSKGENRILTMSKEIFNILNIKYRDTYYKKLESIITFNEDNEPFWDIVNNNLSVDDKMIKLTIDGIDSYVSVSTSPFKEDKFHMYGMVISLTSSKRISKIVTRYTGNVASFKFDDIIGESESFKAVIKQSKIASNSDSNVLLLGESGVGKDVFAQAIHNNSSRHNGPFVALNCASFSKELISSELFGYEEGAFTGAKKGGTIGKFELANNGTLFLDEIGDMPLDLQAILLRVIEERRFTKIGGNDVININARIITATNKNLYEKMSQNLFRDDLFYRLGVIRLHIPPLKERREDIILLAKYFIKSICQRVNKPLFNLSKESSEIFYKYDFPGNVRELKNLLEGIINTTDKTNIDKETIVRYLGYNSMNWKKNVSNNSLFASNNNADNELEMDDEQKIRRALKMNRNNKTKAAKYLGISRKTLYKRLKEYGIKK